MIQSANRFPDTFPGAKASSSTFICAGSSLTSWEATFSSRYFRRLVPRIGTMSSPFCNSHASAICPGFACVPLRFVNHPRRLHIGVEILALEARIGTPIIAFRIFFRAPDRTGQKATAERRKRVPYRYRARAKPELSPAPGSVPTTNIRFATRRPDAACARRIFALPTSDNPKNRTLPCLTRSPIAPATSPIGTALIQAMLIKQIDVSVPSRRRHPSTASRSARAGCPRRRSCLPSKRDPNFVAIRPGRAGP